MATEKWIAGSGVGLTWTAAFTSSTLNSIAGATGGNAILSDLQIDNSSALDMFCDIEVVLASLACVAPNCVGVYFYPLNSDGTTYGDGRFGTSAAGPPSSTYYRSSIVMVAATQAQQGMVEKILLPTGKGKLVLHNQCGAAFASSGNTCKYRTYNRSVA